MQSLKAEVKGTVRLETQLAERAQLKQALAEAEKAMKRWEAKYDAEVRSTIMGKGIKETDQDGTIRWRLRVGPYDALLSPTSRSKLSAGKLLALGVLPDTIKEATEQIEGLMLRVTTRESEDGSQ